MNPASVAALGVAILCVLLFLRWKWRSRYLSRLIKRSLLPAPQTEQQVVAATISPTCLVHKLCPHNNVVQSYPLEQKDSLDEHLDTLTKKLAEKESRLRLSKSKIRETHNEMESLHAIDNDVRKKYRDIMDALRRDLTTNERECRTLQQQIEWVSRRRAELHDQVYNGQKMYGEAAAELASNLADLQKTRADPKFFDKPYAQPSWSSMRHRKEPTLPRTAPLISDLVKSSLNSQIASPNSIMSQPLHTQ